jgi:hypothetical protein
MAGMMTGPITRGVTRVIIATMVPATTHAMTVITRGGIATDITMTVTPTYGARIETITQIDDIGVAGGDGVRILKTRARLQAGPWFSEPTKRASLMPRAFRLIVH